MAKGNDINPKMILEFMQNNGLTKSNVCTACKIHISVLNKILSNKTNFNVIALFKLNRFMGIDIYKIFI